MHNRENNSCIEYERTATFVRGKMRGVGIVQIRRY